MTRTHWLLLALAAISAIAQVADSPAFEVASIKPAKPNDKGALNISPGGAFSMTSDVQFVIQTFYNLKSFQIVGAPGWLSSERYAIIAKSPDGTVVATPPGADKNMPLRVQALLKDRFHLAAHREQHELPVYILVIAKGGSKLKEPDPDQKFRLRLGRGSIVTEGGGKVAMLATLLENQLDRKVIDETGLAGAYKIDLKWEPDPPAGAPASELAKGPTIFTALQEQLGLKLESAKRPVDVLVIDHVERPSEN